MFTVFSVSEQIAGLTLKPPKCVIVPLVPFSNELVLSIKRWLALNIPHWVNFAIKPCAKYLGFFLGPSAGTCQWVAPIKEFVERVDIIGASNTGPSLAAYTFNTRAVPVVSYVGQLAFLHIYIYRVCVLLCSPRVVEKTPFTNNTRSRGSPLEWRGASHKQMHAETQTQQSNRTTTEIECLTTLIR